MPNELTAEQAAARLETDDTLGMPLGPGQPPAFMRALGEREDGPIFEVYGALLAVGTELFSRTGVAYLSGFFGPIERALRDAGANIEFAPADFRRFGPLLELQRPRVMTTVATPPDTDGWCSLSLHAGGTVGELRRAGADPDRLLVVEVGRGRLSANVRLGEDHRHALHVDEIDILVRSTEAPLALPGGDAPPTDVDKAIARHAVDFVPSGATPTGIGSIPSQIATLLAEGEGGDYGLHSEMFTDGCMQLHRAGKVTNTGNGQYDGVSVTTFAFGSTELYAWLDGNDAVAFLPVEIVNALDVIGADTDMVTINGALAIDIHRHVGGRHDLRRPVQRDRRCRGLRGRRRARAVGPLADLPALDVREGRPTAVADRAVVRPRRRDHDAAAPSRRDRHRVRRRRTGGQDRPGAR